MGKGRKRPYGFLLLVPVIVFIKAMDSCEAFSCALLEDTESKN